MDLYVEIPLYYVIISLFIGYMYFYLYSENYDEILSWKSVVIGCVSGFSLSTIAVLVGLLNAHVLTMYEFVDNSMTMGIISMFIGIILVLVGGTCAITVKRTLIKINIK